MLHKQTTLICLLLLYNFGWSFANGQILFQFGADSSNYGVFCDSILPSESDGIRYGLTGDVIVKNTFCTTSESFAFWASLPEGNYRVKVVLGNEDALSNTTIKAESRRLMLYDHTTESGAIDTVEFIVNRRSPKISTGGGISLKTREYVFLNWDKYLTLEFSGASPCVRAVSIEKADVPTIFLAGNSTVVDQENDPWASWGQMLPLFLKPEVAIANFAESGLALMSFESSNRLKKIQSQIDTGDYMFTEFAHNDQKEGWAHVEPYTTYQEYLMKFANVAINKGATPVFVTSTNRRWFNGSSITNTLGDYPDAMRQLADSQDVFMVDLNAMSKTLFETLGSEGSKNAFVHYAAHSLPWGNDALRDDTHFNPYGAWQLAKCVVEGIRASDSPLKEFLKDDVQAYDPATPDPFAEWKWMMNSNVAVKLTDTVSANFRLVQQEKPVVNGIYPNKGNDPLEFYPNPSNGEIVFNTIEACEVEILTLEGKTVFKERLNSKNFIDVSFLPRDVYIVKLRTDTWVKQSKLILK